MTFVVLDRSLFKPNSGSGRQHIQSRVMAQLELTGTFDLHAVFPEPVEARPEQQARGRGLERYAKEYVYKALHYLLLSGVPLTRIALKFGVDVRTVHLWKNRLYERYRKDALSIEAGTLVGEVLENYRAITAIGMRQALDADEGDFARQRAGLLIAMRAQADLVHFLRLAGLLDMKHPNRAAVPK
jgi:hypothetical protein